MQQRRWLVTGATGQLGAYVHRILKAKAGADCLVLGTSWSASAAPEAACRTDLTDKGALAHLLDRFRPTHIAHLAAQASPRMVERDPAAARRINLEVTRRLARFAGETDAWLGFPSSDWVFDGSAAVPLSEEDEPAPGTAYGRLKVEAERLVLGVPRGLVLRLPLLCGLPAAPSGRSTWERMRDTLAGGGTVSAITDEYRTPVSFADAAACLVALGELGVSGLLHGAGRRVMTPYDVILALADSVGARTRVRPCLRSDVDAELGRPRWVALDAARLSQVLPGFVPASIDAATFAPFSAVRSSAESVSASR